jgi:hypothetical protein
MGVTCLLFGAAGHIMSPMAKLLVVIATGDKEKALTGLMYAKNAMKRGWMEDVKVVYFGPSEQLMVTDPDVASSAI